MQNDDTKMKEQEINEALEEYLEFIEELQNKRNYYEAKYNNTGRLFRSIKNNTR